MDGTDLCSGIPSTQGRDNNLGFGLPASTGVSTAFSDRLNQVFGSLQSLEDKHTETVATFGEDEQAVAEDDSIDEKGAGCSETSSDNQPHNGQKRPRKTLPEDDLRRKLDNSKRQNVPNHVVNPEKWKKYSLKDDGSLLMSKGRSADEVNTAVAMDFISQLKKRKSLDGESSDAQEDASSCSSPASTLPSSTNEDPHVFTVPALPNRPENNKSTQEDMTVLSKGSSSNHSSKAWCMDTYEVGKSSGMIKKKKPHPIETSNVDRFGGGGVVLEHCHENDEGDDGVSEAADEGASRDIAVEDVDAPKEEGTAVNVPPVFNSRARKQARGIRKRQKVDDDDDDDDGLGTD